MFFDQMAMGVFEIHDDGTIWRLKRFKRDRSRLLDITPKRVETNLSIGYYGVFIRIKPTNYACWAHRLVWKYLFGDIPDKIVINHKDGDGRNNHPDNLEIVTVAQNNLHAYRVLRRRKVGEASHLAKLTESDVVEILTSYVGVKGERTRLAERYNVSWAAISYIVNGRTWRHVYDRIKLGVGD